MRFVNVTMFNMLRISLAIFGFRSKGNAMLMGRPPLVRASRADKEDDDDAEEKENDEDEEEDEEPTDFTRGIVIVVRCREARGDEGNKQGNSGQIDKEKGAKLSRLNIFSPT